MGPFQRWVWKGGVGGTLEEFGGLSGAPFADGRTVLSVSPAGRTGMSWESCPVPFRLGRALVRRVRANTVCLGGLLVSASLEREPVGEARASAWGWGEMWGQPRMQRGDSAWKGAGQAEGARSSPCLATAGWGTVPSGHLGVGCASGCAWQPQSGERRRSTGLGAAG